MDKLIPGFVAQLYGILFKGGHQIDAMLQVYPHRQHAVTSGARLVQGLFGFFFTALQYLRDRLAGAHVHAEAAEALSIRSSHDGSVASPEIARLRPMHAQQGACSEVNYKWFVNDIENPFTTPKDKPFVWVRVRALGGGGHACGASGRRRRDRRGKSSLCSGPATPSPASTTCESRADDVCHTVLTWLTLLHLVFTGS